MKEFAVIIVLLFVAILLGAELQKTDLRPRGKQTAGLMDKIFGEARDMVGNQLVQHADLYFHGGVRHIDCGHGLSTEASRVKSGGHDHIHEHDHEHEQEDHEHAEPDDEHAAAPSDWLTKLNRRIHPRAHTHMSGVQVEKELLPWLWAAIKADPHNIDAYAITAYWLAVRMELPEKGIEVVVEGIRKNPDNYVLEMTRGEILWQNLNRKPESVDAFQRARKKFLDQFNPGVAKEIPDIPEQDRLYYGRILSYLANYAIQNNQPEKAVEYLREAVPYANNPKPIRARIRELE